MGFNYLNSVHILRDGVNATYGVDYPDLVRIIGKNNDYLLLKGLDEAGEYQFEFELKLDDFVQYYEFGHVVTEFGLA